MILVGTSGFDYRDWRGPVYPEKLPKRAWLTYIASQFPALELNFSYYAMPKASNLASMVERTEGRVTFAIKAHKSMTHDRIASDIDYESFGEAIRPLREAECLGAVLAQFPNSFRQCEENRIYLKQLADRIGQPLAVELRHAEWAHPAIIEWLRRIGVGYACVDEPQIPGLMPPNAEVAAAPAYVRFHGRNKEKWYKHDSPEQRYDYRYTLEELRPWAKKIKQLEKRAGYVLVFFNNHFQGKAVEAGKAMQRLLDMTEA
jgi:uncharacterized protein YecE (DUF72 family)